MFGQRDYSMRIWLDPDKLAARSMTASDVVMALREQNLQVAAGQIGQSPTVRGQQTQITLSTLGRLSEIKDFENVIIKTTPQGEMVRDPRRGLASSSEPRTRMSAAGSTGIRSRISPSFSCPTRTPWRLPTWSKPRSKSSRKSFRPASIT